MIRPIRVEPIVALVSGGDAHMQDGAMKRVYLVSRLDVHTLLDAEPSTSLAGLLVSSLFLTWSFF